MMVITSVAFCVLGVLCTGLQYLAIRSRKEPTIGNNPLFLKFQKTYFLAYFPALIGDWLQGPYLYRLYSHYGFQEDQIAVLYVCGFASSVLFSAWAPLAADRYGRKKLCIVCSLVYSLACFLKLSNNYWVLIIGRVLGGVATSLLFSAFETWYVYEHIETHDFPKEWIEVTFNKASVWNGILAIVGGITANTFAEWFGMGPVSPFMLAIPCLLLSGILVTKHWAENYSDNKVKFSKSCMEGLRVITTDPRICLVGIITALFESVMYIFVFIWTPILEPRHPSQGVVFSTYMICIMLGSAIYQLMASRHISISTLLTSATILALISQIICIIATDPETIDTHLALIGFLVFETAVGMYFPAMSYLRAKVVPEASRRSVMNWFRVPMNLIACVVLMMLHNEAFRHGNRLIFIVCTSLLAIGVLACLMYVQIEKQYNQNADEVVDNGFLVVTTNNSKEEHD